MEKMIVVKGLCALLAPAMVYAEISSVVGDKITYAVEGNYLVAGQKDKDEEIPVEASGDFTLTIGEHQVIHTKKGKASFTPLVKKKGARSQDSVDSARKILNTKLPETYLRVMTLHQTFGGSSARGNSVCEFLALDELLDRSHRQAFHQRLEKADVEVIARNGFISFDCRSGDEKND
ncbi:hypothetical protein [Alcanivorax sp.]|uniref:hypothetical protein n=1 Tax=Alcanivorax sp. TaxID=1872427 RepID=UPI0025C2A2AC|nr:hypothetical protein [Alcanivorax sp.]